MRKLKHLIVLGIFFAISVSALSGFFIDSSKLAYTVGTKTDKVADNFDKSYKLNSKIDVVESSVEKEVIEVTKKATNLLLGDFNNTNESSDKYFQRYKKYKELMYSPEIPKGDGKFTGYDEDSEEYKDSLYTSFALPQLFDSFNAQNIVYSSYGDIRVATSGRFFISMVVIRDVTANETSDEDQYKYERVNTDLVIYFTFVKYKGEYKLYSIRGETRDNMEQYINWLGEEESKGGSTLSARFTSDVSDVYSHAKVDALSADTLNGILNSNINKVVVLNGVYNSEIKASANGFFIRDGLIVTTWTFIKGALNDCQTISIFDSNGNAYAMDGIVTINPDTDIAVVKLKTQSGVAVNLGDTSSMSSLDPALTLSSKMGVGFILQKGVMISNSGYLQLTAVVTENDQGSPVLDQNGNVIGMNTAQQVNSGVSIAINSKVLKEVFDKFKDMNFTSIKAVPFSKLKENYYQKYDEETVLNSIPKSKWKTYSKIGDIENTISLDLVKASYKDGIVSLRYLNKISDFVGTMQLADSFSSKLVEDGYKLISEGATKKVYSNNKYKVVIMSEFDYLIVVMVKL